MQRHPGLRLSLIVAAAALALGCADGGAAPSPAVAAGTCVSGSIAPPLTGPFCVGVRRWVLSEPARPEPFTREPSDPRRYALTLHYPIPPAVRDRGRGYGDVETWGLTFGAALIDGMQSQGVEGAPMAEAERGFPVLLYSPGFEFGLSDTNTFLIDELVSRGFAVAAVDHPHVSLAVRMAGDEIVRFGDGLRAVAMPDEVQGEADVYAFPTVVQDLASAIDRLAAIASEEPEFAALDLSRVGAFGHSYGGAAAAELLRSDHRVAAAIDLDGRFHPDVVEAGVPGPLLLVSIPGRVTGDPPPNDNFDYRTGLAKASPGYFAEVGGAVHGSFQADIPWLLARNGVGATPELEPDEALSLLGDLAGRFFDRELEGDARSLEEVLSGRPWVRFGRASPD